MKVNDFIEKYNFHDCRAYNFNFDERQEKLCFNIILNSSQIKDFKKDEIKLEFIGVKNLRCSKNLKDIDEYLLNIYKCKANINAVEIIFDDDEYLTLYLEVNDIYIEEK